METAADRGIAGSDRQCNAGRKNSPCRDALRGNPSLCRGHIICPAIREFLQSACAISSSKGLRVQGSPFRVNNPANYPVIRDVAKRRTVIQKRRRNCRISAFVPHGAMHRRSTLLLKPRVPVKGNNHSEVLGSTPPMAASVQSNQKRNYDLALT